ncbi:RNA-binding S4 domain-containing protein [Fertoeibacter niger]|uniref:RNA-binding S4 domain-containing protein n=1 Tax=Fertoeibacter niger TaxID=2656921 RepID=UPI003B973102
MIRLDKWLVQARFVKTRSLAAELVDSGHVRVNGQRSAKPAQAVGPGDVLVFPQGNRIRMVRITGVALRRGSASDALALYLDLDAQVAVAEDVPPIAPPDG